MARSIIKHIVLALIVAQTGSGQGLVRSSFPSGAATSENHSTVLSGTVGLPFVGCAESGSLCLTGGFLTSAFLIVTAVGEEIAGIPGAFGLHQNFPNPFNAATVIRFDLPRSTHVRLSLYDVLGKLVRTVVDEERPAGVHQTDVLASELPSGVYFYRLSAGEFTASKRFVLLK